jgi:hypothetical protein
VSLFPGQFHVGIVFVAETRTLGSCTVGRFKIEIPTTAATIELDTGANVSRKAEIPRQRLEERFVKRRTFAFVLFAIGVS